MNSEEEFYDAETGQYPFVCFSERELYVLFEVIHQIYLPILSPSGLESDDSCEVSFKDALVTDGSTTQENGVWERR